jgi:hypothetical protein
VTGEFTSSSDREPTTGLGSASDFESTGDARVDAAIAQLDELDVLDPPAHGDVYADVHAGLQAVLADVDDH